MDHQAISAPSLSAAARRPLRVLMISDNFPPEVNAPATRTYEHCRAWAARGAEVTVLTCAPNFPDGRVFPGYRNRLWQIEERDGIRVVRLWSFMARNEGFLKRIVDFTSFAASSFVAGLFQSFDVVVATSPQFFTTFSAFAISKLRRKPWVFELRDLWPDTVAAVGAVTNRKALAALEKLELFLYRDADRIVAVTHAFKANLVSRGIRPDKIEVVTNGVALEQFSADRRDESLLRSLQLEGKFVVGYVGTHGVCQGLGFVLGCAEAISDPRIHFLFVGAGAEKAQLVEQAKARGLRNVTFLDPVPKEDVPRYLSVLDVGLVPLRRSSVFETVIPSKIFEYAAAGKPILLGVEGEARELVERYAAGRFYAPEDRADFVEQLAAMAGAPAMLEGMRAGCARLAADFDRNRLAGKMLTALEGLRPG